MFFVKNPHLSYVKKHTSKRNGVKVMLPVELSEVEKKTITDEFVE